MHFSRAGCARLRRRICPSRSRISARVTRSTSRRCRARPRWTGTIWRKLAADPLVTIGSATVNYPVLSNLKDAAALREMTMGRAVAQAAFRRDVRHFAYPFGDRASWRRQHVAMAEEAGFVSAVSAIPGVVEAEGRTNLHALPRITWDGRRRSLRAMRVMLSGARFPPVQGDPQRRDLDLGVRPRHPADDRHRRQHPADAGHDIEDRPATARNSQATASAPPSFPSATTPPPATAGRWFRGICGCVLS